MSGERLWPAGLATLLALSLWPAGAAAAEQTFCVDDPACSGTPQPTVADALAAAAANGSERDRIQIGSGTFNGTGGTLADGPANPVIIDGAGAGVTVLTRTPAFDSAVLRLANPQSAVSDLRLHIPGDVSMRGLELEGSLAERVNVTVAQAASNVTGVRVQDGTLRRSSVALRTIPAQNDHGVVAKDGATVDSLGITAYRGVLVNGTQVSVRGLRITAHRGINMESGSSDSTGSVENTQVTLVAPAVASDAAIEVRAGSGDTTTLNVRHVTLLGAGAGRGLHADAPATTGSPIGNLDVRDSLVRGFTHDLRVTNGPAGTSSLAIDNSAYDFAKTEDSGNNQSNFVLGPNNLNLNSVDPRLRSFQGDMRPGFDSPLVDRGVPGALLPAESTLDLAGLPRLVDGDGDGTARRDIGAFEYQRAAPLVTASAEPASAGPGQAIAFSASAAESDPEESASAISWSFDDGSTASGESVQHAFATPGAHTATASSTDTAGVTGSASVTVAVVDSSAPALVIGGRPVRLTRKGMARVPLTCPSTELSGPCAGRLALTTIVIPGRRSGGSAKQVRLGSARFSIASGATRKVGVKLSRRNRKLVVRLRRVRVSARATVSDAVGNAGVAAARFRLRAPARRARR